MSKVYRNVSIGVDQSYKRTGISVIADGEIKDIKSVCLEQYKCNSEKRRVLRNRLDSLLSVVIPKSDNVVCVMERARIHGGPNMYINLDAIKAMGALCSVIADVCYDYGIPSYSVDTRCWKAQVIGTSKPMPNKHGVPDEKWPTVMWVVNKGFENKILRDVSNTKRTKGIFERGGHKYEYDNDAADSAAIGMYYFKGDRTKLQLER